MPVNRRFTLFHNNTLKVKGNLQLEYPHPPKRVGDNVHVCILLNVVKIDNTVPFAILLRSDPKDRRVTTWIFIYIYIKWQRILTFKHNVGNFRESITSYEIR